jgi:hypothetical protein
MKEKMCRLPTFLPLDKTCGIRSLAGAAMDGECRNGDWAMELFLGCKQCLSGGADFGEWQKLYTPIRCRMFCRKLFFLLGFMDLYVQNDFCCKYK